MESHPLPREDPSLSGTHRGHEVRRVNTNVHPAPEVLTKVWHRERVSQRLAAADRHVALTVTPFSARWHVGCTVPRDTRLRHHAFAAHRAVARPAATPSKGCA